MTKYWCQLAWLGGDRAEHSILIETDSGRIASVRRVTGCPADATRLDGLTLPGLANAHSHAFHRALRGRTESDDSFWSWRERMYELAAKLDPDRYFRLARAVFGEMALAGFTAVGEFHYLHHGPRGQPYDDPNEIGVRLTEAAAQAGIRITLLDTCYLHGGIGEEPDEIQRRFSDGRVQAWAERADLLTACDGAVLGAAIHSVRAVAPDEARAVAKFAAEREWPLHAHVSEQPAENEACLAAYGRTPSAVLDDAGALGSSFTAVHATHLSDADVKLLGASHSCCCICPTTERSLADGIGPAADLARAGSPLAVGTDSHAIIDGFEETRAIELDERLESGQRGRHRTDALLTAATAGGHTSIGWPAAGSLAPGAPADLLTVRLDGVRAAGVEVDTALEFAVYAATAADVARVVCGGREIVRDGQHCELDVPRELRESIAKAWE